MNVLDIECIGDIKVNSEHPKLSILQLNIWDVCLNDFVHLDKENKELIPNNECVKIYDRTSVSRYKTMKFDKYFNARLMEDGHGAMSDVLVQFDNISTRQQSDVILRLYIRDDNIIERYNEAIRAHSILQENSSIFMESLKTHKVCNSENFVTRLVRFLFKNKKK